MATNQKRFEGGGWGERLTGHKDLKKKRELTYLKQICNASKAIASSGKIPEA